MESIRIINGKITTPELKKIAVEKFGDMFKAVVDLERSIMAVGGEMHADEEAVLLESGSKQADLWGINIYPDLSWPEMVEFDSMINIRPNQGNRSRSVEDGATRDRILTVVRNLLS